MLNLLEKLEGIILNMSIDKFKESFKKLPFEKKQKVFRLLAEKATNDQDGEKINTIEKDLARTLVVSWSDTATKAINKALATIPSGTSRFTQADANRLIKTLEKAFEPVEEKTSQRVENDLEEIYKTQKRLFASQFNLEPEEKVLIFTGPHFDPIRKQVIKHNRVVKSFQWNEKAEQVLKQVTFGINDTIAYENLAKLQNIAIGDHFEKTLKPRVSSSIQKNIMDKGLNTSDAALTLEQDLTRTLGGSIEGALPASVATGQASIAAYMEGLVATNTTFAKNFAQIQLMDEVGITQIVFTAIIDRLTSQVCSQMDGRIFTVEQAKTHRESVLESESVAELKGKAPFTRNLSQFNLSAGESLTNPDVQANLARAGVIVPPLHFRCRSELHPA